MLKIEWLDVERSVKCSTVFDPEKFKFLFKFKISITKILKTSYHIAVQSKWTISHLDGLNAIESAWAIPFSHTRNSGQMNALPA